MSLFSSRRFPFVFVLLALLANLPGRLAADLVWTPQGGWKVEGVLSGVNGNEGKSALEMMNKAREAEERGSKGAAIKYYQRVAKKYSNSIYAPEALYRVGKLRLSKKQYLKSFDAFEGVVLRYPNTPRFNEIVGEQYRIASALLNGARGRIMWGMFPGFTNREKSVEYFEQILIAAPYSDYAPLALMNIARGHQKLGNIEEAIDALDRMINTYPQSLLTPDAYLKLAQTHASLVEGPFYDQESTRQAVTYFEDFMILFPSDNSVATAEKGLGDMKKVLAESKMKMADFYFYRRDNFKAARVFYNEAISVYPDSVTASKARQRLAEVDAAAAKAASQGMKKKKHFWFF